MLKSEARTGWERIWFALVHVAILAFGIAGLATFAVTMSEATPASRELPSTHQDARGDRPVPLDVTTETGPSRLVRVVYPGR